MAVGDCGTFKCTEKLGAGEGGGRYDLNDRLVAKIETRKC